MRNRTTAYFEGKISQVLSKNPNITVHELAIKALYKQQHTDLNEFYLDCAIAQLGIEKQLQTKKVIQKTKSIRIFPIAA